jgi:hypothetical protein
VPAIDFVSQNFIKIMKKLQILFGLMFILLSQSVEGQTPGLISNNDDGDGSVGLLPVVSSPYYQLNSSNSTTSPISTWYLRFASSIQQIQFSRGGTHSALRLSPSAIYADVNLIANQKIGIGTQLPSEALQITNGFARSDGFIVTGSSTNTSSWNAPWYGLSLANEANLDFSSNANTHPVVLQGFYGIALRTSQGYLGMDNDGIVSIGLNAADMNCLSLATNSSNAYKLYVEGGIRTEEVLVDVKQGNWCDYVFEPNYRLRPLSEVEAFINQNKHLPEVPSAVEVETNGVKLGEMDAILLKKVEELTLYVIELEKKIKSLEQSK